MKLIPSVLLLTAAAASGLAACGEKPIEPPSNIGVCWHAIPQQDGTIKFNELARSEEHTSELQSPECISYAVFCLKKKNVTPSTDSCLILVYH